MADHEKIAATMLKMQRILSASFKEPNPEKKGDHWTPLRGWLINGDGADYQETIAEFSQGLQPLITDPAIFEQLKAAIDGDEYATGLTSGNTDPMMALLVAQPALAEFLEQNLEHLEEVSAVWDETYKIDSPENIEMAKAQDLFFAFKPKADKRYRGTQRWDDILARKKGNASKIFEKNLWSNRGNYDEPKVKKPHPRPEGDFDSCGTTEIFLRNGKDHFHIYEVPTLRYSQQMYDRNFKDTIKPVTQDDLQAIMDPKLFVVEERIAAGKKVAEKKQKLKTKIINTSQDALEEYCAHSATFRGFFSIKSRHGPDGRREARNFAETLSITENLDQVIAQIATHLNRTEEDDGGKQGNFNHWSFKTRLMLKINEALNLGQYTLIQYAPRDMAQLYVAPFMRALHNHANRIQPVIVEVEAEEYDGPAIPNFY